MLYPGSFDPVTLGHLDILERARRLFDRVTVAVAVQGKAGLLGADERVALLRASVAHLDGVEVHPFSGLLVDEVRRRGADAVVRGIRTAGDYEHEWSLAGVNALLADGVEYVYFLARPETGRDQQHPGPGRDPPRRSPGEAGPRPGRGRPARPHASGPLARSDDVFLDIATITVTAGDGGDGCVSTAAREVRAPRRAGRRQRRARRLGLVRGRSASWAPCWTSATAASTRPATATSGGGNRRTGADGEDVVVRVPCGTMADRRAETATSWAT